MCAFYSLSGPLQERVSKPNLMPRAFLCIISGLIASLLLYRVRLLAAFNGLSFLVWLVASLCELWFSFIWILNVNLKWNFVEHKTFPENLLHRFKESKDFPRIDIFVTTTDPVMEPPIITINTVLSILAVDYPASKMACYVSDDACSPITFYSLLQASKFARFWVSFCKKYEVKIRAPFQYFPQEERNHAASELFHDEWLQMKIAYEELTKNINKAIENPNITNDELSGHQDFQDFANIKRTNHDTVIKVIHEHDKAELEHDEVPHLIYVSREKRPSHPHHFKAGAMNVLIRTSGVMTNAPFMLNLDCDMFVNNPKVMHHALCLLLGFPTDTPSGFVQFPQMFYDGQKDDPYGSQLKIFIKYLMHGMEAYQGTTYGGTGCFHRRKIIYGQTPCQPENSKDGPRFKLLDGFQIGNNQDNFEAIFGSSGTFNESVRRAILEENTFDPHSKSTGLSGCLDAVKHVSSCDYERQTHWGKEVGMCYGTVTEDVLTGLKIHSVGWRSIACWLDPPAFLGCAPCTGHSSLIQQKRWATGLLEILFHPLNPIAATIKKKLQVMQCLAYLTVLLWAARSFPEFCYVVLPAFCIIMDVNIFPKV